MSQSPPRELMQSLDTEQTLRARDLLVSHIEKSERIEPRVLQALRVVPRHVFVPQRLADCAYDDGPLPIGASQTISQPTVVAMMSDALQLSAEHVVLEVGTGSGYQAAVLSRLCREVHSLEVISELAVTATRALASLGYDNVHVQVGDGYVGLPAQAPFDGIIITAAPEQIPTALLDQLRDGGRMVVPVGPYYGVQELLVLCKRGGNVERTNLGPVRFVPMVRPAERQH